MTVVPFPTPNTSSRNLAHAVAAARPLALSTRFRGRSADAVRWTLAAPLADVDMALAADDTLALIRARRALRKALRAGDRDAVAGLRPVIARLYVRLRDTARRNRIRGWHIAILVGAVMLSAAPTLPAQASDCASIRNGDRRAACEGRTRSRTACEAIRDSDRRAACRAEARS